MPYVKGNPAIMECLLERSFKSIGFVLIRDGSIPNPAKGALVGKPSSYARKYQWYLDGNPVQTFVTFFYDLRTGWADFKISYHDLEEFNREMTKAEKAEQREW